MNSDQAKRQAPPRPPASSQVLPWWREPMMWLVVGGPATVVLASFATLALALLHPDPVLPTGAALQRSGEVAPAPMQPAVSARNHAATGGVRHARP
jgi:hypothetical protein